MSDTSLWKCFLPGTPSQCYPRILPLIMRRGRSLHCTLLRPRRFSAAWIFSRNGLAPSRSFFASSNRVAQNNRHRMRRAHLRFQTREHLSHFRAPDLALGLLDFRGRGGVSACLSGLCRLCSCLRHLRPVSTYFRITWISTATECRGSCVPLLVFVLPLPAGVSRVFLHQSVTLLLVGPARHFASAFPARGSPHEVLRATLALARPLKMVTLPRHATHNESETTDVSSNSSCPRWHKNRTQASASRGELCRGRTSRHMWST